jgi:hypothetical protein
MFIPKYNPPGFIETWKRPVETFMLGKQLATRQLIQNPDSAL